MLPINQVFENFLSKNVNLSQNHISQGAKSHQYIRGLLQNKSEGNEIFPWLIDGDFLSGSYARGTKIYPLDDIDVLIILDGTGLSPISNGVYIDASVRGSGTNGSPIMQHTDDIGLISSQKVLEVFRDALKESYPSSEIKKDGQAINVWLDSYGLGLDIVPAFHIIPNDQSQDYYYIPKGQGSHSWMSTNPKIDQNICENLDQRHEGKLKKVIKLLKFWNQNSNGNKLKPYHLEVVAWHVFHNHPGVISDYATAIRYFFNNANTYLEIPCPDPTGLGGNIDNYLTDENRQQILKNIEQTKKIINSAFAVGIFANPQIKLGSWRSIFGDQFGV